MASPSKRKTPFLSTNYLPSRILASVPTRGDSPGKLPPSLSLSDSPLPEARASHAQLTHGLTVHQFSFQKTPGKFFGVFYLLKVLEPTQGSLGHGGSCSGATEPGVRCVSVSVRAVRPRVSRRAGASQHAHSERPPKASPAAQASSTSRGSGLAVPLLRRAAFQGTKGRVGQDSARGGGRHIRLRHELLPVIGAITREACVGVRAGTGRTHAVLPHEGTRRRHCHQRPGTRQRHCHQRIDVPPSRPEQMRSSHSDASFPRQWGFLLRLVCS